MAEHIRVSDSAAGIGVVQLEMFAECASRPEALALVRAAQERYDAGADSSDAFGVPRP